MILFFSQTKEERIEHVQVATHVAEPRQEELVHRLRTSVISVRVGEVEKSAAVVDVLEELEEGGQVGDHHQRVVRSNGVFQRVRLPVLHVRRQHLLHQQPVGDQHGGNLPQAAAHLVCLQTKNR